jgi:hypothetical protein
MTAEDNTGLKFKCIQPVMLTPDGILNFKLPQNLNTFYLKFDNGNNEEDDESEKEENN